MQRLTITVPRFYNDSKPVSDTIIVATERDLVNIFDGFSRIDVIGEWYDDSKRYRDVSYRYEILTDVPGSYATLGNYARDLCKILSQKCVLITRETVESVDFIS